jgi:hypothetical protein
MTKKSAFKIGDKVTSTEKNSWTEGLTGTIIPTYPEDKDWVSGLLVKFDAKEAKGRGHGRGGVDGSNWYIDAEDLKPATDDTLTIGVPNLAKDLTLPEQARKVLAHLEKHGDITRLKADKVYGIVNLPDCVYRLKRAGYSVRTERPVDDGGVRYVRYVLA